jgi:hypothetical protein
MRPLHFWVPLGTGDSRKRLEWLLRSQEDTTRHVATTNQPTTKPNLPTNHQLPTSSRDWLNRSVELRCVRHVSSSAFRQRRDRSWQADTILIFSRKLHAYVALFAATSETVYVADGSNDVFENTQLSAELGKVGTVRTIWYEYETRKDYCGSAAAVIVHHLAQCHLAQIFRTCQPLPSLRRRTEKRLHPHPNRCARYRLRPHC